MAKSMRSKRQKRLRAIRREIVEPFHQKKDDAKLAALEAALSAPKLPPPAPSSVAASGSMQVEVEEEQATNLNPTEVEMADGDQSMNKASSLKAIGRIGKKSKIKLKLAKKKRRSGGKGKIRGKRNL